MRVRQEDARPAGRRLAGRRPAVVLATLGLVGGLSLAAGATSAANAAATRSAAATAASASAPVTGVRAADSSGCVTEDFSEADEGIYEVCVRDEQILLNNLWNGYVLSNLQEISVDGYYGPQTEADVLMFQADAGISRDGITGPQTWWWLCHINATHGFQGVYWHGAGCATEGSSPPS
jgi:zinc D-Ala-D-Ala carboxypeptidase